MGRRQGEGQGYWLRVLEDSKRILLSNIAEKDVWFTEFVQISSTLEKHWTKTYSAGAKLDDYRSSIWRSWHVDFALHDRLEGCSEIHPMVGREVQHGRPQVINSSHRKSHSSKVHQGKPETSKVAQRTIGN